MSKEDIVLLSEDHILIEEREASDIAEQDANDEWQML